MPKCVVRIPRDQENDIFIETEPVFQNVDFLFKFFR